MLPSDFRPGVGGEGAITELRTTVEWPGRPRALATAPQQVSAILVLATKRGAFAPLPSGPAQPSGPFSAEEIDCGRSTENQGQVHPHGATLSQLQELASQPWNRGGIKSQLLRPQGPHPAAESPPLSKHFSPATTHTEPEVKAE